MGSYKKLFIIGTVSIAVFTGLWMLLGSFFPVIKSIASIIWIPQIILCTFIVIRGKKYLLTSGVVLRFALTACLGLALLWLTPWYALSSSLGKFATNVTSAEIAAWMMFFIQALCVLGVLFFVIALTTKTIQVNSSQFFIRLLLIIVAITFIHLLFYTIEFFISEKIESTIPSSIVWYFVEGTLMQLLYGFAYYFVTVSFLSGTRSLFGGTSESQPLQENRFVCAQADGEKKTIDEAAPLITRRSMDSQSVRSRVFYYIKIVAPLCGALIYYALSQLIMDLGFYALSNMMMLLLLPLLLGITIVLSALGNVSYQASTMKMVVTACISGLIFLFVDISLDFSSFELLEFTGAMAGLSQVVYNVIRVIFFVALYILAIKRVLKIAETKKTIVGIIALLVIGLLLTMLPMIEFYLLPQPNPLSNPEFQFLEIFGSSKILRQFQVFEFFVWGVLAGVCIWRFLAKPENATADNESKEWHITQLVMVDENRKESFFAGMAMGAHKKLFIIGLAVIAVLTGLLVFSVVYFSVSDSIVRSIWIPLFAFCAYMVMRGNRYLYNPGVVLRFILTACVGLVLLWFSPWIALSTLLAKYITDLIGYGIVMWTVFFTHVFCASGILFLVIATTTKTIPKALPPFFIRYVLILAAVSFVLPLLLNIFVPYLNSIESHFLYSIMQGFVDGTLTQLFFGFAYYFVTVSFFGETRSFGGETLEIKPE